MLVCVCVCAWGLMDPVWGSLWDVPGGFGQPMDPGSVGVRRGLVSVDSCRRLGEGEPLSRRE